MCQYMLQVTKSQSDHAFYRCEHGTFHLVWGNGIVSLALNEVHALSAILKITRQSECCSSKQGRIRLRHQITTAGITLWELWISDVGIRLFPKDCALLDTLVDETIEWISAQPPFSAAQHIKTIQLHTHMDALPISLESLSWN